MLAGDYACFETRRRQCLDARFRCTSWIAVNRPAKCRRGKQRMPDFPSPLPLAAFEEYMLRDDRPKYPMSIIRASAV